MNKYLIIALLALSANLSAQTEGVWEEYVMFGDQHVFLYNIEVVNVNNTWLLLTPDHTFKFRTRLDGTLVSELDKHGQYYSFDKRNKIHAYDSDGEIDVIKLNKIK